MRGVTTPRRPSYATVQVLRGIAASAVVLFHLLPFEHKYLAGTTIAPGTLVIGQAGVDVFFVISGFIITTVSAGHTGHLRDALGFLVHRCTRIYPTYWVYFVILLAVYLTAPEVMNQNAVGSPSLLDSFLLLPSSAPPLLLVAWTLSFELYFYLVFAVLLWLVPRARLGFVLPVWAALVVVLRLLVPSHGTPLLDLVDNPLNLEFIAGCGIALWAARLPRIVGLGLLGAGLGVGGLLLAWFGAAAPFDNIWARVGVFGTVSALLIAGCAAWERPGQTWMPRPLVRLGDASYSLYLSHLLTIGAVGMLWRHGVPMLAAGRHIGTAMHATALLTAFAASVGIGWASYRLIEQKLAGLFKRARRTRSRPTSVLPQPASLPVEHGLS